VLVKDSKSPGLYACESSNPTSGTSEINDLERGRKQPSLLFWGCVVLIFSGIALAGSTKDQKRYE